MSQAVVPSSELFGHFLPFRRLQTVELALIARRIRIEEYRRGTEIAAIGDIDGDEVFLLKGSVSLIARDSACREVNAGSASALGALSQLRPRQYRVVANSLVEVVLVPVEIMQWVNETASRTMEVDELDLDENDDDDRIFAAVLCDLPHFNVNLPVSRQGAASIRSIANASQNGVAQLGQAAMIEPSVAAKLIAAANHPLSAPVRPVQNCFAAASHLGEQTTRRLLNAFTSNELIPDRYSAIYARFSEVVRRSREVAYLCAQLAELSGTLVATNAYLIGLLHAVGEIAALSYAEPYPELCLDQRRFDACLNRLRPTLSATILRDYGFNSDAVVAASCATEWLREVNDELDYADLVILAQLHSAIGTVRARNVPPMHTIPAFSRVANGELSPSRSLAMIRMARTMAEQTRPPNWQEHVA